MMKINIPLTEELEPFADDLEYFVRTMVRKLHVNRHKGNGGVPMAVLHKGLEEELKELGDAIKNGSQFDVELEGVDVANFAFLLALRATALDKPTFRKEAEEVIVRRLVYPVADTSPATPTAIEDH